MTPHPRPSGGRGDARRLLTAAAIAVCATFGVRLTASDGAEAPNVTVEEARGVFSVAARFHVPEPRAVVVAVLTDYERIPRFMPNVRTSIVRRRFNGGALVEQEAVSRMLMFSRRVHLLLEVHEEAATVRFRDICGRSFSTYAGAWRLSFDGRQTLVSYELSAEPAFDVPRFVLKRLLTRDAKQMIERLRAAITEYPGM